MFGELVLCSTTWGVPISPIRCPAMSTSYITTTHLSQLRHQHEHTTVSAGTGIHFLCLMSLSATGSCFLCSHHVPPACSSLYRVLRDSLFLMTSAAVRSANSVFWRPSWWRAEPMAESSLGLRQLTGFSRKTAIWLGIHTSPACPKTHRLKG